MTTDSAVARAERTLARALLFFRVGGLVEIVLAGALDLTRYRHPLITAALVALVVAESALLVGACLRIGNVRAGWVAADVVFCTAALAGCAALTAPAYYNTWTNFMYPFTIITSFGIGAGFRKLSGAAAITTVLAAGYIASAITLHGDPAWNVLPNGLTYFANMIVAWLVARHLLANGRELDASRAEAVANAGELARQTERARHARILHDRVLQTLETLARGDWVADKDFREHIATEADWLRALVEGVDMARESDLLAGLQRLVTRNARIGLRVEFNGTRLRETRVDLPPDVVDAVLDATQEALTNVAKHAGVTSAVLRAAAADGELTVSVLDQGVGFDPTAVCSGTGLQRSIRSRVAEQGGEVRIDSTPGAGTYVEIVVRSQDMTDEPAAATLRGWEPPGRRPTC
jgi:signal transduction histidine kinase